MRIKQLGLIVLSAILLSGCAGLLNKLPILAVDSTSSLLGQQLTYQLQWQDGKDSGQMLLVLAHQNDSVQLVGLSNTSVSLFSLQRDNDGDHLQKSYFYRKLPDAHQLLNQLLMAYYSEAFIQQQLGKEWQLVETAQARQWLYRGEQRLMITFAAQQLTIESPKQQLRLHISAQQRADAL